MASLWFNILTHHIQSPDNILFNCLQSGWVLSKIWKRIILIEDLLADSTLNYGVSIFREPDEVSPGFTLSLANAKWSLGAGRTARHSLPWQRTRVWFPTPSPGSSQMLLQGIWHLLLSSLGIGIHTVTHTHIEDRGACTHPNNKCV